MTTVCRYAAVAGLALTGCDDAEWRGRATAAAEQNIDAMLADPAATFSRVQVTGDGQTGQTCGYVSTASRPTARFIAYIDGSAGPYLEGGLGKPAMDEQDFEAAWQADCVREGYRP